MREVVSTPLLCRGGNEVQNGGMTCPRPPGQEVVEPEEPGRLIPGILPPALPCTREVSTAGLLHCPFAHDLWREVPAPGHGIIWWGGCQSPQEAGAALGSLAGTGRRGAASHRIGAPSVEATFLLSLKSPKGTGEGQTWDLNPKEPGLQVHALTQPRVKTGGFFCFHDPE